MKIFITLLTLFAFTNSAYAAETVVEKGQAKAHDIKRGGKKKVHEVEDRYCTNVTEKNCYAKNTSNKASEVKEYTKDKVSQGSNIIDNE